MNHTVCDDEFARPYNAWAWHILPRTVKIPATLPHTARALTRRRLTLG
ncbi:hypothetical protein SAMN04489713_105340 [Actinomadura madurae]|uniref:Uncharacterized protein n=1 Tax=Actinomadura madurae TaxID=1993 RepID=A0A1I5GQ39_9ACTN|nr:hypothetical protein SAMN04489713_105340 [Actinomadura madurae]SPT51456.1 Uncharacterised protein [Actinomadura madurae]